MESGERNDCGHFRSLAEARQKAKIPSTLLLPYGPSWNALMDLSRSNPLPDRVWRDSLTFVLPQRCRGCRLAQCSGTPPRSSIRTRRNICQLSASCGFRHQRLWHSGSRAGADRRSSATRLTADQELEWFTPPQPTGAIEPPLQWPGTDRLPDETTHAELR